MKLRNILIVVKDIARARKYYHDLFGLDMLLDNDGNMILTEGLVLQQEACWTESLNKEVLPRNNHSELYFEETDIEAFAEKLYRWPGTFLWFFHHQTERLGRTFHDTEFRRCSRFLVYACTKDYQRSTGIVLRSSYDPGLLGIYGY